MAVLRDVMSSEPTTMEPTDTVTAAAARMVERRLGSILVTQGRMLVGIFTERDVMRAAASGSELSTDTLQSWMTPDPITEGPDTDTEAAAELMLANGFRHLPVVDESGLVGVVSVRDLLSARIRR